MMVCYGAELLPYFVEPLHYEEWLLGCEKSADDAAQRGPSVVQKADEAWQSSASSKT